MTFEDHCLSYLLQKQLFSMCKQLVFASNDENKLLIANVVTLIYRLLVWLFVTNEHYVTLCLITCCDAFVTCHCELVTIVLIV